MANELTHIFDTDSARFRERAQSLYTVPFSQVKQRYDALIARHCAALQAEQIGGQVRMVSSPGRIEVIGNHTDHNNGKVLAASISVDLLAAVTPLEQRIVVDSVGYPRVEVGLDPGEPDPAEFDKSEALVRGVLRAMLQRGYRVGGFYATTVSDVFKGAGMSSSASFELMVVEVLNQLYNGGKIGALERAVIAQYAENVYFGKPSGLLDQSAVSLGGIAYIDFRDVAAPEVEKLEWNFDDLDVVVVNCGGDHCNLTPNYAAIRTEMEQVAAFFGVPKLRFVDEAAFYARMGELKAQFSGRAILRAIHFFEENRRVDGIRRAILQKDEDATLAYINASGQSSYCLLQNCYPEGDSAQPIPLALQLIKRQPGVRACRVHGGGFAGTVLALAQRERSDALLAYLKGLYGGSEVHKLKIRPVGACMLED